MTARPGVLGPSLGDVPTLTEEPFPASPPYDVWRVPLDGGAPVPIGPIREGNTRTVSMDPLGTQVVWDGELGVTEVWAMERIPRE
jgi:hypothetical protein